MLPQRQTKPSVLLPPHIPRQSTLAQTILVRQPRLRSSLVHRIDSRLHLPMYTRAFLLGAKLLGISESAPFGAWKM